MIAGQPRRYRLLALFQPGGERRSGNRPMRYSRSTRPHRVENRNEVGMIEHGRGPCFALEPHADHLGRDHHLRTRQLLTAPTSRRAAGRRPRTRSVRAAPQLTQDLETAIASRVSSAGDEPGVRRPGRRRATSTPLAQTRTRPHQAPAVAPVGGNPAESRLQVAGTRPRPRRRVRQARRRSRRHPAGCRQLRS